MRRFLLLAAAVAWAAGMLSVMGKAVSAQSVQVIAVQPPQQMLTLPCPVEDTQMTAQMIVYYEGPFREDGSDQEVAGVAALVVENGGGTMISEGAVIIEQETDRLVFELFALPAGEKALVLEKDGKAYSGQTLMRCYGWERREYPENMGHVTVTKTGNMGMLITNRTDAEIPLTRIRYKSYHEESGMYIGGICYEVAVTNLTAGEQRIISPYHYLCDGSRIVCVNVEVE